LVTLLIIFPSLGCGTSFINSTTVADSAFEPPISIEWKMTFGGAYSDNLVDAKQTNDGGYIFVGCTHSYGDRNGDIWLLKTDSFGNKEWQRTFGGEGYDDGYSVQQTRDGGYIISGETNSYGTSNHNVWLIKTDPSGNKKWDRTFDGRRAREVREAEDGGYVLATDGSGPSGPWLIKTDSSGNNMWQKQNGAISNSVQQTIDGGYIVASGKGLTKTDSLGNINWKLNYDGWFNLLSVKQTKDGGYVAAGWIIPEGSKKDNVWLIKTDSSGNKEWERVLGGQAGDTAWSIQETPDGGFIMTGDTYSKGAGDMDVWLIKTDSSGNIVWDKTFGESGCDGASSILQTNEGGYILVANTWSNSLSAGEADAWIIKLKYTEPNSQLPQGVSPASYDQSVQTSNSSIVRPGEKPMTISENSPSGDKMPPPPPHKK